MENGTATSESSSAISQKVKHKTTIGPGNSPPKRTENTRHSKTYTQMCVATLLITAKHTGNNLNVHQPVKGQRNVVHPYNGHYSAINGLELPTRATS